MPLSGKPFSISDLKVSFDEASNFFVSVDRNGALVEANGCIEKSLGYPFERLRQIDFQDLVHPDDREKTNAAFRRLLNREIEFLPHFENRYIHANGSIRHILWVGFAQGENACGYGRDITVVRTNERAFAQMQEGGNIGAWRFIVGTGKSEWTAGTYRIYEFDLDTDADAANRLRFYPEAYRTRMRIAFEKCLTEGKSYEIEAPLHLPSGKKKWIRTTGHAVKFEGKVVEMYGILQDITDSKLQQVEIEQQRMSLIENAKLSALGQMAAGIAHEIYNPLTVIQGKTLLSLRNGSATSKDLEAILNHCRRIDKIIRGMTTLVRTDHSGDTVESFEASSWFSDIQMLCKERLMREGVSLETEIPDGLRVIGQPIQLSQVMVNLLNNSLDAMSEVEKGRKIRMKITASAGNVEFAISNTGPAIPEEIQDKMFEPFFTTKPIGKGTGLGLSIARAIAQDHGGELVYDCSEIGPRFTLRIPSLTR